MQTKNRILPLRLIILMILAGLFSGQASTASARYRDAIDLPALEIAAARYGLTLDVTRAGRRMIMVGERGHILYSDDQAQTWHQADVGTRAHLNAVTFPDTKNGWAVGEDAVIVHTTDGGGTWVKQFDDRNAHVKGPLLDLWFKNSQEGFAVGVYNKMYKTADSGKTWLDWSGHIDNPDEWHLFAIAAVSDRVIYLASEQGLIFRSADGGDHFTAIQTSHFGSFHNILVKPGKNGRDTLALSGVGGILLISADSGKTWRQLETHSDIGLSGSTWLTGGALIVVGLNGIVLRTDPSLTRVRSYPQPNGLPLSSVAELAPGQLVVVGFGGPQLISTPEPVH